MDTRRKLNIAMVCDPIGDYKAGVIVSTVRFSKLLRERGHTIIYIGANDKVQKGNGLFNGVKTYRYRSIPLPKSGGWHLALPKVSELAQVFRQEKIDVVHIILPMSGAISAIKAARKLNIKIVAHSHSQPENLFMDMPGFIKPILNNIWNRYLAWIYNKAVSIIYPSEMAHELLSRLSRKGQSWKVISNGIDTQEFKPEDVGDFLERFNVPKNKVKLLFVGRLFPEKSVDTLIRALPLIRKQYADIHVMIVGGGYLRPSLEALAKTLYVTENITFLGLVSEEDKVKAYNASDIFVLPSVAELEGMVVLEAMACGKPIIISDSSMSASRFFVQNNGLLFHTFSPEDLAEKSLQLIQNPTIRKEMGHQSILESKNYDINKSVEKLEAVYYSALNI